MNDVRPGTARLELRPLPAGAAATLPHDRETAAGLLGAKLHAAWPQPDLLDVLPLQAVAKPERERFGIWVMIERETNEIVGDIGFMGLPDDGILEIGFSVIADRRRRGYATEAAQAMVDWALHEPGVRGVIARCDSHNAPSIGVLEGAGFLRVAEADGQISWRIGSKDEAS